ncbi:glycolipid transfer protein [Ostrinia furnacalis]|uniref:glycolipid transfer protein n=1 Tax=Ostrinia furnacalis TaxID=93504 RepID=UPI00103AF889|nr:glycolipid transfer protein [Ostrinia furnacalis]
MASSSGQLSHQSSFWRNMKEFPPVIDGRIHFVSFLEAANDLISLVERLGKVFVPVKYDMQGNIDKVKKHYQYDEASCLLELMLDEYSRGKLNALEGILWLNRAFLFFELAFQEIIKCLQSGNYDINMAKIFTVAYEGSVKKYHNWVTQQIFFFICKMSPSLLQLLKSLEVDSDMKTFETKLVQFNITLHLNRCKIDDFFKDHQLFED